MFELETLEANWNLNNFFHQEGIAATPFFLVEEIHIHNKLDYQNLTEELPFLNFFIYQQVYLPSPTLRISIMTSDVSSITESGSFYYEIIDVDIDKCSHVLYFFLV
jgi:hypothetical protein